MVRFLGRHPELSQVFVVSAHPRFKEVTGLDWMPVMRFPNGGINVHLYKLVRPGEAREGELEEEGEDGSESSKSVVPFSVETKYELKRQAEEEKKAKSVEFFKKKYEGKLRTPKTSSPSRKPSFKKGKAQGPKRAKSPRFQKPNK